MIKLHSQCTGPDYTEKGRVSTDCMTVGKFMTDAASIYGGCHLKFYVDSCIFDFCQQNKVKISDETPIDEVLYSCVPGRITFFVKTKPKQNIINRSGWIQIYKDSRGYFAGHVRENKEDFKNEVCYNCDKVATVRVEWEEVEK